MSIISCREFKQRSGDYSATEKGNQRTYTRSWLLVSNDPADSMYTVVTYWSETTGLQKGSYYHTANESDTGSYLQHVSAHADGDDGLNWLLSADYKPYPMGATSNSPLDQPAEITWSFQQTEKVCDKDIKGKAVCNSAGDPFSNPITCDMGRPILNITQNETNFDAGTACGYVDTVNSSSFQGCPARTVKCVNIGGQRVYDQQYGFYWKVSYEFAFRPETWDKKILDAGFRVSVGDGKITTQNLGLKQITQKGIPISTPALLDGGGGLGNAANPQWKTYEVYEKQPFSFNFRT